MAIEVVELDAESRLWHSFSDLARTVYHNDLNYTGTAPDKLRDDIERWRTKSDLQVLLALEDGQPVARVVVRAAENFIDHTSSHVGLLGTFEAMDNQQACHLLFDHARQWLAKRDIDHLIGPMDGDTWHRHRFNMGPYDDRSPFMMEPYNPPWYPQLWESYGFQVLAGYYSKRVDDLEPIIPGFKRFYSRTLRNGFTYRPFQKDHFDQEMQILYDLSCRIFQDNHFYRELSFSEFASLYSDSKSIIHKNLVWFSQDKHDQYCGFVFAFPDYFRAMQSMDGSRNLWARIKFLLNKNKADAVNVKTLGTLPAYHGTGLGPGLLYKAYSEAFKMGYRAANLCLIHQDNVSGRLDGNRGQLSRTYHLYHMQP